MSDLAGTIGATAEIAGRRGRSDLVERLDRAQHQRDAGLTRVVVVGDFKSGKSSLVNALVGFPACPVDDDLATAVLTSVAHAPEASAEVAYRGDDDETVPGPRVPLDQLGELIERGHHEGRPLASVAVGVPSPF
ncbi:MAG: dynamin family protein, partial [Acidimicrobiales bacterium]|nr:dynamin family protein [Acidimicrobiales bacterium]